MSFKVGDRVRGYNQFDGTIICEEVGGVLWGVEWDDKSRSPGLYAINALKLIESKPSMPVYNGTFDIYDSMYIRSVYK